MTDKPVFIGGDWYMGRRKIVFNSAKEGGNTVDVASRIDQQSKDYDTIAQDDKIPGVISKLQMVMGLELDNHISHKEAVDWLRSNIPPDALMTPLNAALATGLIDEATHKDAVHRATGMTEAHRGDASRLMALMGWTNAQVNDAFTRWSKL